MPPFLNFTECWRPLFPAGLTTGQGVSHVAQQVIGVPYFVFNAGYSLSGVYSPVEIASAMELAVAG